MMASGNGGLHWQAPTHLEGLCCWFEGELQIEVCCNFVWCASTYGRPFVRLPPVGPRMPTIPSSSTRCYNRIYHAAWAPLVCSTMVGWHFPEGLVEEVHEIVKNGLVAPVGFTKEQRIE